MIITMATENANPQTAAAAAPAAVKPPLSKKSKKKVSISPKKPTGLSSPRRRGGKKGGRRSSSHFQAPPAAADSDADDDDDDDDDIEFTLDGATDIEGDEETKKSTIATTAAATTKSTAKAQRRRRRSSARFLRLSNGGAADKEPDDVDDNNNEDGNYTSSEHLGEIYRQAIRMNAENKINAGNSWGLKLIENMDKFLNEESGGGAGGGDENLTPRSQQEDEEGARNDLKAARKMKSKDDKGRINFTKASCTLDASVKIYSYRVDDVHLSSYRVLANLNRTDTKKDEEEDDNGAVLDGEEGSGQRVSKRRTGPRGPTQTIENNKANINMSKLDSAYDIDPLFHKMSKAFDEGGAKGLLLGNLGVSHNGCHIVFDSKENEDEVNETEVTEDEGNDEEKNEDSDDDDDDNKKMEEFGIDPEEAVVWKESEIDITSFAAKLETMLDSYGAQTSASVPFVPQLESLREDYATLEKDGYAVDEKDNMAKDGRKRLRLYDAPEEEEKEAERSIHVIATERSRASILGTSMLGMSFGLSMDMGDGEDNNDDGAAIDFNAEDLGGEGEFAPADDGSFGGGGEGEFAPDFGSENGGFGDARSYNNTKTLLDALCDADAFYEGSDYAFFDVKKFEKATDGNLWAGSQHWKKGSGMTKKNVKKADEKKKVMFENDNDEEEGTKKQRKKATKKDRVFVDFSTEPDVGAIFQKKKTTKKTKKTAKDSFQMAKTEKDFLLPPDANVDITQLTRLFSRPNAVVRRTNDTDNNKPIGKTVGFYDVEENALGFNDNDDADFGGDDGDNGGFNFAYDEDEPESNDVDYNTDNFDEVRKVEKIDINYAQVAKKVDVRRLKKDLWTELEEKTAWIKPEESPETTIEEKEEEDDDMYEDPRPKNGEPQYVSFKETCEKLDNTQGQHGVTVSFYFICCLHLANEKGLKFDSNGSLEDFMISLDDGSAPTFGTFGDGFTQTVDKLKSRESKRDKKVESYVEEDGEE